MLNSRGARSFGQKCHGSSLELYGFFSPQPNLQQKRIRMQGQLSCMVMIQVKGKGINSSCPASLVAAKHLLILKERWNVRPVRWCQCSLPIWKCLNSLKEIMRGGFMARLKLLEVWDSCIFKLQKTKRVNSLPALLVFREGLLDHFPKVSRLMRLKIFSSLTKSSAREACVTRPPNLRHSNKAVAMSRSCWQRSWSNWCTTGRSGARATAIRQTEKSACSQVERRS